MDRSKETDFKQDDGTKRVAGGKWPFEGRGACAPLDRGGNPGVTGEVTKIGAYLLGAEKAGKNESKDVLVEGRSLPEEPKTTAAPSSEARGRGREGGRERERERLFHRNTIKAFKLNPDAKEFTPTSFSLPATPPTDSSSPALSSSSSSARSSSSTPYLGGEGKKGLCWGGGRPPRVQYQQTGGSTYVQPDYAHVSQYPAVQPGMIPLQQPQVIGQHTSQLPQFMQHPPGQALPQPAVSQQQRVLHAREPLPINGRKLPVKVHGKSEKHLYGGSTNHQGRRFKGHPNRRSGGYFEEPQLKLDLELQRQLASVNSAEQQLKLICRHYKMPVSAIRAHLDICTTLTTVLQSKFPSGLVVPFGAAISGHGTRVSDCDICLFTQLSELERALFTPPNYQPQDQKPTRSLTPSPSTPPPPPPTQAAAPLTSTNTADPPLTPTPATSTTIAVSCSPVGDELQSSSSKASSSPSTSPQAPRDKATSTSRARANYFDMVSSSIQGMAKCSKVKPIPHARCPIIRFIYEPNIHCDLSIDNVLGPANTRLMQAYCQFDERFALLVPFVRLWVKHNGPPRKQLNSYAVSLMFIYSLQRCTPPVLPCLQNPGTWPKNRDWFSKHGFQPQQHPQLTVGPWLCDFVSPDSLLPSTNTQTPVELLLHFFKFYSEWRSFEEVVAIHCPPDETLSPSAAKALATAPQKQGYKVHLFRDFDPFIIQDPFEFDHNLCKALSKSNFTDFICNLKIAAELLASNKNLLPLFDRKEYQKVAAKLLETRK